MACSKRHIIEWEGPGQYAPVWYTRLGCTIVTWVIAFAQTGDTVNLISEAQAAKLGKVKIVA